MMLFVQSIKMPIRLPICSANEDNLNLPPSKIRKGDAISASRKSKSPFPNLVGSLVALAVCVFALLMLTLTLGMLA